DRPAGRPAAARRRAYEQGAGQHRGGHRAARRAGVRQLRGDRHRHRPGQLVRPPVSAAGHRDETRLVQVRLAQRPNGSTAWLPASDVTLGRTPYRIVVNNTTAQLALYDRGKLVFSAPAGVGTTDDPTPTGAFFVAFDEQPPQPNPGYGPFIIVTSAHSQAISDWESSGDAIIGIHGPLGEDSQIGAVGARISHGCV